MRHACKKTHEKRGRSQIKSLNHKTPKENCAGSNILAATERYGRQASVTSASLGTKLKINLAAPPLSSAVRLSLTGATQLFSRGYAAVLTSAIESYQRQPATAHRRAAIYSKYER